MREQVRNLPQKATSLGDVPDGPVTSATHLSLGDLGLWYDEDGQVQQQRDNWFKGTFPSHDAALGLDPGKGFVQSGP